MKADVLNGTVEAGDRVAYGANSGLRIGKVLDVHEYKGHKRLKVEITHGLGVGMIVYYPYLRHVAKLFAWEMLGR